jgi:hypothetical protein
VHNPDDVARSSPFGNTSQRALTVSACAGRPASSPPRDSNATLTRGATRRPKSCITCIRFMLKMRRGPANATLWLRWIGDKSMAWHKQIGRRWSPQHAPQECQLGPKSKGEEQEEQGALDHKGERCRHHTGFTIGAGLHQLPVWASLLTPVAIRCVRRSGRAWRPIRIWRSTCCPPARNHRPPTARASSHRNRARQWRTTGSGTCAVPHSSPGLPGCWYAETGSSLRTPTARGKHRRPPSGGRSGSLLLVRDGPPVAPLPGAAARGSTRCGSAKPAAAVPGSACGSC